jgi:hypothetical protein
MRMIVAALAACLIAAPHMAAPVLAQPNAQAQASRALQEAEAELREALRRIDEGTLPPSMTISRLRQALNDVERAMLLMPAAGRQGAPWTTAVEQVSGAIATLREDSDASPAEARAAAGQALSTIPALRGAETGSEGG